MNLKKYVLAIVLAMTSLVVGATEMQASSEASASASCWWIFCVTAPSDPVPMGPGSGGDPPDPVTISAGGTGDPPGPNPN